jgi:hypothetical protein
MRKRKLILSRIFFISFIKGQITHNSRDLAILILAIKNTEDIAHFLKFFLQNNRSVFETLMWEIKKICPIYALKIETLIKSQSLHHYKQTIIFPIINIAEITRRIKDKDMDKENYFWQKFYKIPEVR